MYLPCDLSIRPGRDLRKHTFFPQIDVTSHASDRTQTVLWMKTSRFFRMDKFTVFIFNFGESKYWKRHIVKRIANVSRVIFASKNIYVLLFLFCSIHEWTQQKKKNVHTIYVALLRTVSAIKAPRSSDRDHFGFYRRQRRRKSPQLRAFFVKIKRVFLSERTRKIYRTVFLLKSFNLYQCVTIL